MARNDEGRWAVVNTNLDTGESVRYMETPQEFVADLFVVRANAAFKKAGANSEASVERLS